MKDREQERLEELLELGLNGLDPLPTGEATEIEDISVPAARFAMWSDGRFEIQLDSSYKALLTKEETDALVAYITSLSGAL